MYYRRAQFHKIKHVLATLVPSDSLSVFAAPTFTSGSLQVISSDIRGQSAPFLRNRTAFREGTVASLSYMIGHAGDDTATFPTPSVMWLKDGQPARAFPRPTNVELGNGRLVTTLTFTFMRSDAGVYQCVFTDPITSQMFLTVPIRLDTGEDAMGQCLITGLD